MKGSSVVQRVVTLILRELEEYLHVQYEVYVL